MKNKILKKVGAYLAVFGLSSCAPGFFFCPKAYENVVTSPSQALYSVSHLVNGDDTGFKAAAALIQKQDNKITITFNDSADFSGYYLDEPLPGEMYFAVFMDQKTGTNLAMQPLIKGDESAPSSGHYKYSTEYEAPSNVDIVSVHIYKQQSSLSQFYPIKENFIGKFKNIFTASNDIYLRQDNAKNSINKYDNTGTQSGTSLYYNRLTPNHFTLYYGTAATNIGNLIAGLNSLIVIEPVEGGGGQNMTQEDKVFAQTGFYQYMNNATVPASAQALPANDFMPLYDLNIPDDLTKFYLKIYNGSIADANLKDQYYIDLSRS